MDDGGRQVARCMKRAERRGEEERRQRARKTGERDREMEPRCVRWRGGSFAVSLSASGGDEEGDEAEDSVWGVLRANVWCQWMCCCDWGGRWR
ncbi:hypothetical protein MRB53_010328 [Persea americana]|uniref:Uncharacterized protein n=1 Tax=Persea americana TaxID=3435 RepID=A0ACC2LRM5_PERAE|nr:hypothetical protein MRB53_010328 [Persea americana]